MQPFPSLATVDRLVHEPVRLTILTMLSLQGSADFLSLQRTTGISKGNLSNHLAKLAGAGLVRLERRMVGRQPATIATLTEAGSRAVEQHWQQLEATRRHVQFELARRYLDAPEGSDEHALAGAALSSALAREQGHATVERGGDARVVFAHLRQRRQSHEPR